MNQVPQQQQQLSSTALLYNAAGQPVAVTLPAQHSGVQQYKSRQSTAAGAVLIIAGVLSIVFNAVGISLREALTYGGTGIWVGVMLIITGAFGLAAAGKNRCLVIAFMVLAIISACLAGALFSVAMPGIFIGGGDEHPETEIGIMCALMALMAVTAAVAAIWGSVLGCKVTCCGGPTTGMVVGTNQPVVLFTQQPHLAAAQVGPMVTVSAAGAPPTYMSSVGMPGMQQQQLSSQANPSVGYYGGDAAALPPPSVYDAGDTIAPVKI